MVEELLPNATTWWGLNNDSFDLQDGNQTAATFFPTTVVASADPAFVRFRDESRLWVQRVSVFIT